MALDRLVEHVGHGVRHLAHVVFGAVGGEAGLHLLVVRSVGRLLGAVVQGVLGHLVL